MWGRGRTTKLPQTPGGRGLKHEPLVARTAVIASIEQGENFLLLECVPSTAVGNMRKLFPVSSSQAVNRRNQCQLISQQSLRRPRQAPDARAAPRQSPLPGHASTTHHSEWAPRSAQADEVDLYSTKGAAARLHTTVPNGTAAQNKQARTEMDEPEGVQAASGGEPSCEEPQL